MARASPRELLDMIMSPGFSRPDQWQVQIQAQIQLKAVFSLPASPAKLATHPGGTLTPIDSQA